MSSGAAGTSSLLRGNPEFRALTASRLVSYTGDGLSLVALMLHVAQTTGQALAVAVLLLVGDCVPALLSPLAGAVADRFDRRRTMIVCELVQAGLLVLLAAGLPPLPLLLALVGARAVAFGVFAPAARAALPSLVGPRELPAANATLGIATFGAEVAGPLLAAVLLPLAGTRGVLAIDAATFTVSALLLLRLPALVPGGGAARDPFLTSAREGLAFIRSSRPVRIIVLGFCAVVAATGIDDVALLVLATDTLGAGASAVGLLLAAVGIGLAGGLVLLARVGDRVRMGALLVAGFLVSSAGNLLTGFAWAVAAAFAVQAVRGLGIAAMDVAHTTLLQRLVPDAALGRVFANLHGGIGIAAALSYVAGGLLLDATSAPTTFVVSGAAGLLAGLAVALTLPRAPVAGAPPAP